MSHLNLPPTVSNLSSTTVLPKKSESTRHMVNSSVTTQSGQKSTVTSIVSDVISGPTSQSTSATSNTSQMPKLSYATAASHKQTWRNAREATVSIKLNRGQRFNNDMAYNWIIGFADLNIHEYKPVSAGYVNRNFEYHITLTSKEKAIKLAVASRGSCVINGSTIGKVSLVNENVYAMRIHWLPTWLSNDLIEETLQDTLDIHVGFSAKVMSVQEGTEDSLWGKIKTTFRMAMVSFPINVDAGLTPATMTVEGGDKAYPALISVLGLPPKCLDCKRRGHTRSECPYPCRRCKDDENLSKIQGGQFKWSHTTLEHAEAMEQLAADRADKSIIETNGAKDGEVQGHGNGEAVSVPDTQISSVADTSDKQKSDIVIPETQLNKDMSSGEFGGDDEDDDDDDDDRDTNETGNKRKRSPESKSSKKKVLENEATSLNLIENINKSGFTYTSPNKAPQSDVTPCENTHENVQT